MGHSGVLEHHLGGMIIMSDKSEMRVVIACEAPLLGALLRLSIEDAGFKVVREVSQSTELLVAVSQHVPDIVILDLELPEVENIKLIESILDLDSTLAIVTVSNSEDDLGEMVFAAGARAFLQKPFSMYDLIDIVRKVAPVYRSHC
jgi:DNA-binding NarL/FixJ family response regulator